MSDRPTVRTVRLPPPGFSALIIPKSSLRGRRWYRVHQSHHAAVHFSLSPTHRFSHGDCSSYPFLYLAGDIGTALFERFGDAAYDKKRVVPRSLWEAHSASWVQIPTLQICDLTSARTLSAIMVDLSALMHQDLACPRLWGLAIQKHPANFHGIRFKSRFSGKSCLAVFQRDPRFRLRESRLDTLSDLSEAVDWLDKHKVSLY
jgi:hypothetical protein